MTKAKNAEEYIARQRVAIAGNPDCGVSRYNLAVGLMGLQKYDEAEKELIATTFRLMISPADAQQWLFQFDLRFFRFNSSLPAV